MQLLTEEIKNRLPKFYETETVSDKEIVVKFFNPCGAGTWYVVEGEEQENGDWLFFGLAEIQEKEWGYFSLSELENFKGFLGIGIERDLYFEDMKISDVTW